MAKGKKTGGRDFKPGQITNPRGFTPIPPEIKAARKLTQIEWERLVNKYLGMSKQEIISIVNSPETPMLELLVASIIQKGVVEGDEKRMNFLLDRQIGKVVQPIERKVSPLEGMTPEQKLEALKEATRLLEQDISDGSAIETVR